MGRRSAEPKEDTVTSSPSHRAGQVEPASPVDIAGSPGSRFTPVTRFRTHQAIVDYLEPTDDDVLLDLGCGNGVTMVTAVKRVPPLRVIGLDVDAEALAVAAAWLDESGGRFELIEADLSKPLPVADASVTKVVCHDVVELLEDPMALVLEARRAMRPGAISVWSHTDFDSVVVNGADVVLTRRVVHANADYTAPHMGHSDGQMGRKLAGLIARSPLERVALGAQVLQRAELVGPARARIDDMVGNLRIAARAGEIDVTLEDLESWMASLEAANERGEFFYAQTAYTVVARCPLQ